jgi:hypothetical protein
MVAGEMHRRAAANLPQICSLPGEATVGQPGTSAALVRTMDMPLRYPWPSPSRIGTPDILLAHDPPRLLNHAVTGRWSNVVTYTKARN